LSDVLKVPVEILVEAQVRKTESVEKVAEAVRKLFPEAGELRVEPDRVVFVSTDVKSLQFLKDQMRDRRVRSSARRLLMKNWGGDGSLQTHVLLNKQAATVGIGALCDDPSESALGPIVLRMNSPDLPAIMDWLTAGYDRSSTS
jgi:uncharacterized protein